MRLHLLLLPIALPFMAGPAPAMPGDATQRVVNAIRQNDCRASDADLGRMEAQLGMTRAEIGMIASGLAQGGQIVVEGDQLRLSDKMCDAATPVQEPDFALAHRINQSESAAAKHILALFAANGCQMSWSEYHTYLDQKFPPHAIVIGSGLGEAWAMMMTIPRPLLEKGLLEHTDDKDVVISKGPGCN